MSGRRGGIPGPESRTGLVRPAMTFFVPIAVAWLLAQRRAKLSALLVLGVLVVVTPWTVRNVPFKDPPACQNASCWPSWAWLAILKRKTAIRTRNLTAPRPMSAPNK